MTSIVPGSAVGKTIFLACQQGFESRYLLRSSLFDNLERSGAKLIALVPNPDESYLANEFDGKNIVFERHEMEAAEAAFKSSRAQQLFRMWRAYGIPNTRDLSFLVDKFESTIPKPTVSRKRLLVDTGSDVLRRSSRLRRFLVQLESRLFPGDFYSEVFDRYRPDLVVAPTPGYLPWDAYLLRQARHRGCATAAVLCGWDRSISGGMAGIIPDTIAVWSEPQRDELVEYQGIPSDRVFVGGAAIFDRYSERKRFGSRAWLYSKYDLDPTKKLIVFATKSPRSYPNHMLAEILAKAVDEGRFTEPCQLIVRLHPIYFKADKLHSEVTERALAEYEELSQRFFHVHLSVPTILSDRMNIDMPASELEEIGSLVCHADVLVTLFSTILLEAAACDTPVVDVAFDPKVPRQRTYFNYRSIAVAMNQSHNRRLVRTGATRLAHDEDELFEDINIYLRHPELDADLRRELVLQEVGSLDGRLGERIAAHLLSLIC